MNNDKEVGITIIPITREIIPTLADIALRKMGGCELCDEEIPFTMCPICLTQICEKHCADPKAGSGNLKCVNCKDKEWDGVVMTLGEARELKAQGKTRK
jgi:hypothetical protein